MKRVVFIIHQISDEGETWKKPPSLDERAIRTSIRTQMCNEFPVIIMPPGAYLSTVEIEDYDDEPEDGPIEKEPEVKS